MSRGSQFIWRKGGWAAVVLVFMFVAVLVLVPVLVPVLVLVLMLIGP